MFWDEEYIDEKVDELKDMIKNNTFEKDKCNNFIYYEDLEDEFSHNEIEKAQQMFINRAKDYLLKNYPGKYAIWRDYCVHISTVELYKDIMKGKMYRAKLDIIV